MHLTAPVRVWHTYTQTLDGSPAAVLPLLCPVRETEWGTWESELNAYLRRHPPA